MSLARDVGGGLLAGREADEDALPVRRVGLLRLLDHRLYHDAPERNCKIMLRQNNSQICGTSPILGTGDRSRTGPTAISG